MKRAFVALVSLCASTSLLAQAQTQALSQPTQALPQPEIDLTKFAGGDVKTDVNKIICRQQDEIGSRLRHNKVCLTQGQWLEYEAENRQHIREMERLGLSSN